MATTVSVTPHDLDAEKVLLGACLINSDLVSRAAGLITPQDFFRHAHSITFESMLRLQGRGTAVDLVTIKDDLDTVGQLQDVGGPAYLSSLTDGVPRSTHVENYAQIVKRFSVQRQWMLQLTSCQRDVQHGDIETAYRALRSFLEDALTTETEQFLLEPIADLAKRIGTALPQPLIEGLVYPGCITLCYGLERTNKSIAIREIAAKSAAGLTPFGLDRFRVAKPLTIAYFTEEDLAGFVLQHLDAFSGGRASKGELPIYLSARKGITLDDPRTQDRIIRETEMVAADMVVMEPLRPLTECVDQGPRELRPFQQFARRLMRATGAALLLGHHEVKRAAGQDNRGGNQRISGGGLASITECPLHFERIDATRVKVTPTGFKYSADGEPVLLRLDSAGDRVQQIVAEQYMPRPGRDIEAEGKLLKVVLSQPGLSSSKVVNYAGVKKDLGLKALHRLESSGRVKSKKSGNSIVWFAKGDPDNE
jgi:hypothetical protein